MVCMTQNQFDVISKLIRSRGRAKTAAYIILVTGGGNADAMAVTGLSPQSVSNVLRRYKNAMGDITGAFPAYSEKKPA